MVSKKQIQIAELVEAGPGFIKEPDEYTVNLQVPPDSSLSLEQVYEAHKQWLLSVVKKDPKSEVYLEPGCVPDFYLGKLSPKTLQKIRQREEVEIVFENCHLVLNPFSYFKH